MNGIDSKGEIPSLEIIPSVRRWTDEEIEADGERIKKNPTRLDRIRAFSQFVNAEAHALVKFAPIPGFCVQHAYNNADSGPVGAAAERAANAAAGRALLLRAPFQRVKYNPHPALLRTLSGHTAGVLSVSITPDGKLAVSGSKDKTLRVWELATGRCLRTLAGHTDYVLSVSITPDGNLAVSGGGDTTLRVWELATGRCIAVFHALAEVLSASVGAGGAVVAGSGNEVIVLFLVREGEAS